eukprot:Lithocolla_globosa_v1_NODE_2156_length_2134_cov_4.209135.p1 type:complete len:311 gc:universal NODE_2156_length_2134_cov_4.209135:106-1038(+)
MARLMRGLLSVTGKDSGTLLHSLTTQDMLKAPLLSYCLFLAGNGRVLCDALVYKPEPDTWLLEVDPVIMSPLVAHLKRYRMRSKVVIEDVSQSYSVLWSPTTPSCSNNTTHIASAPDPRVPQLGYRTLVQDSSLAPLVESDPNYQKRRLSLGVAEGTDDVIWGGSLPFHINADLMQGVSFNKGCYLGQELTARTHFRGVTRKRLVPVQFRLKKPDDENEIKTDDDDDDDDESFFSKFPIEKKKEENWSILRQENKQTVGKCTSVSGNLGLALLRLDCLNSLLTLQQDGNENATPVFVSPHKPAWWPQNLD